MAKKTNGKTKNKRRGEARRQERRFVSQTSTNPALVNGLGALAALVLGAGAWAYFYAKSFADDDKLRGVPSYLVAGGAVLLGIVIWIGSSSEPPVRVGDPGISLEKGELRRMPWWAVSKITFDSFALALVVTGKDESNTGFDFKVPLKAHPEAVAFIVKEAQERIPRRVEIGDELMEKLPVPSDHAGQRLDLDPLQVVGKRCAATDKVISYEPDARVCTRCERVYVKTAVPKKCKCGASLAHLRSSVDAADDADDTSDDDAPISSKPTSKSRLDAEESADS